MISFLTFWISSRISRTISALSVSKSPLERARDRPSPLTWMREKRVIVWRSPGNLTRISHLENGLFAGTAEALAHGSGRLSATVRCVASSSTRTAVGSAMATSSGAAAGAQLVWQCVGLLPGPLLHLRFGVRLKVEGIVSRRCQRSPRHTYILLLGLSPTSGQRLGHLVHHGGHAIGAAANGSIVAAAATGGAAAAVLGSRCCGLRRRPKPVS